MPGCDGFDVVDAVAEAHLPIFIFVTAYDQYAVRAFEAHALDYLLKPFDGDRFVGALERARQEIGRDEQLERHERLVARLETRGDAAIGETPAQAPRRSRTRFTVKDEDRFLLIKVADVDWIESAANYVRLHTRGATFMMRATMAELERRLDPEQFARIHRTTIVNIERVQDISPDWHGDFDVRLRNGTMLRLSRSYRERLLG